MEATTTTMTMAMFAGERALLVRSNPCLNSSFLAALIVFLLLCQAVVICPYNSRFRDRRGGPITRSKTTATDRTTPTAQTLVLHFRAPLRVQEQTKTRGSNPRKHIGMEGCSQRAKKTFSGPSRPCGCLLFYFLRRLGPFYFFLVLETSGFAYLVCGKDGWLVIEVLERLFGAFGGFLRFSIIWEQVGFDAACLSCFVSDCLFCCIWPLGWGVLGSQVRA